MICPARMRAGLNALGPERPAALDGVAMPAPSLLPDVDPTLARPALAPYGVLQLCQVHMLPYFRPGAQALAKATRGLKGLVFAAHLDRAVVAMKELEATARLTVVARGQTVRGLKSAQIAEPVPAFELEV